MKLRPKNMETKELIRELQKKGLEKDSPLMKSLAKSLNRPRRVLHEVNLSRIDKHTQPNDNVVVAGVVLGLGDLKKPVTVAALKFSSSARKKIEESGGECVTLKEMLEKAPKNVRILG